ncbi:NAD(P)-dependent oxidoreductase [Pedobacter sp. SYP-B3415]|uniref:NAD(P)-dependent oxidoreductase n=1 Tax=Pedobacter sp. SYP-B3415 TaxID=2496641 RepID=UPI0013EAE7E9|nr:NAD(P)-binding domain-containing protein [Pedobacter sp. SYP-B3415]
MTNNNLHTEVSVIGLGAMGSAVARVLLDKGLNTEVWNRDVLKAGPLVAQGAIQAESATAAIANSPVTIACLSDYQATDLVLQPVFASGALSGKTFIQLSGGTANEARTLAARISNSGGSCLNGNIMAWPRQIGSAEAMITICGPQPVYNDVAELLNKLAGTVSYLGPADGASAGLSLAGLSYLSAVWMGFCHGALICQHEGLSVDEFGLLIESLAPVVGSDLRRMGQAIHQGNFAEAETPVDRVSADLDILVRNAREADLDLRLARLTKNVLAEAQKAGYGGQDVSAIFNVLRDHRSSGYDAGL